MALSMGSFWGYSCFTATPSVGGFLTYCTVLFVLGVLRLVLFLDLKVVNLSTSGSCPLSNCVGVLCPSALIWKGCAVHLDVRWSSLFIWHWIREVMATRAETIHKSINYTIIIFNQLWSKNVTSQRWINQLCTFLFVSSWHSAYTVKNQY